jgi:hypothetical protein
VSVDSTIDRAGVGDDEVSEAISFRNPHYFAAGATLYGTEAQGAYEYEGQTYNGRLVHVPPASTCVDCHNVHALEVNVELCTGCHTNVQSEEDLASIRMTQGDFDGDGDETEGIAGEIATMEEALYAGIQAYAADTAGAAVVYDPLAYPYFFTDANANGAVDEGEEGYATWTPRLLRAAYNYQWAQKDPGDFAHNPMYILEVLYDSIQDIGGDATGMTRPTPPPPSQ